MSQDEEMSKNLLADHSCNFKGVVLGQFKTFVSQHRDWEELEVYAHRRLQNDTDPETLGWIKGFYFDRRVASDHKWIIGRDGYRVHPQAKVFAKCAFDELGRVRSTITEVDEDGDDTSDSDGWEFVSEDELPDENAAGFQKHEFSLTIRTKQAEDYLAVKRQRPRPFAKQEDDLAKTHKGVQSSATSDNQVTRTDKEENTPLPFPKPRQRLETDNVKEISNASFFVILELHVEGKHRFHGLGKELYKHMIRAALWRHSEIKFLVAWPLGMPDEGPPFKDMKAAGLSLEHQRCTAQFIAEKLHLKLGFVSLGTSRWFVRGVEDMRIQNQVALEGNVPYRSSRQPPQLQTTLPGNQNQFTAEQQGREQIQPQVDAAREQAHQRRLQNLHTVFPPMPTLSRWNQPSSINQPSSTLPGNQNQFTAEQQMREQIQPQVDAAREQAQQRMLRDYINNLVPPARRPSSKNQPSSRRREDNGP
ncbi:hypothetical protein IWX48DRAFT_587673 [Phyllosticta citricarpa]